MVRVITVDDMCNLLRKVSLKTFFLRLVDRLEQDYARWEQFERSPRHATHFSHGVIELMPIADQEYYAYKFVNGHPSNPLINKQTVVAVGMLAEVASGYPVMLSEMTLLTAIRTAATSALGSKLLARKSAKSFGIIGTGAQSEFQALAHFFVLGIKDIYYYDIDPKAMDKFNKNLTPYGLNLHACKDARHVVEQSDILTTATADKQRAQIVDIDWVKAGCHINGIGGDCPGKTELDAALVKKCKIIVELLAQSSEEGEIQHIGAEYVHAELWEVLKGDKSARTSDTEITLFDSVGFALEDYSVLRLVSSLAEDFQVGHVMDLVPDIKDPKNLFSTLSGY